MIWNSIGIMSTIDALIVGVVIAALYFFFRHQRPLTNFKTASGPLAVAFGLGVTGVFYSADLFTMLILPSFVPRTDAISLMTELHLNFRWILTIIATVTISFGFLLVVRRMQGDARKIEQSLVALRESEERRRLFMDSATEHFVLYDANLNLIDLNATSLEALGCKREDVIGRNLVDVFPAVVTTGRLEGYRQVLETGNPFEVECDIVFGNGRHVKIAMQIFKAGDGLGVSSADITERRKVEAALRESEERGRLFMDSATEHFTLYDADLNLIDANAHTLEMFARDKDDVIGKNLAELFPQAATSGRLQEYRKVLETGESLDLEIRTSTAEAGPIELFVRVFKAGDGIGVCSGDVTEQRRVEAALHKSEERRRLFMDSATDSFVLYDSELNLLDVNATTVEALGWKKEDVIGRNLVDLFPDAATSGRLKKYRQVLETGEPIEMDVGVEAKENGRGHLVARIFKAGDGIGISTADISERKKADAALRESEARLNAFFAEAPAGLVILDRDLRYIKINETLARYHGLTAYDHVGRSLHEVSPGVAEALSDTFRQVLETGDPVLNLEYEGAYPGRPNAKTVSVTSIFPILGPDGTPRAVGAISTDITERKRTEAALRESEERWRKFTESATESLVLLDADLNLVDINPAGLRQAQVTNPSLVEKEDAIGKSLSELSPDAITSGRSSRYLEVLRTGNSFRTEVTLAPGTADQMVVYLRAFPVANGLGVISHDITELKMAEAALRESEELRRLFMDSATENFALFNSDLNLLNANAAALAHIGASLEDAVGKPLLELLPDFASNERHQRYLDVVQTGCRYDTEVTIRANDGGTLHLAISAFQAGEGIGVISRDITDRKQAEAALRESEELRRRFMDSSSATFAVFDSELNFLDLNAAGLDRLRLSKEDVIGKNLAELSKDTVTSGRIDRFREVIRTGKAIRLDSVPYEARDGRHSVLEFRAFRVADGLGVISEDITERTKAEAALRASEENLNLFFESAKDDFALFDHDMNLLHSNDSALKEMGSSREMAIGSHLLDIDPQLATTDRYAGYLRVIETGDPYEAEVIIVSQTGEKCIKSLNAFPAGNGVGIVTRDITQQKLSEAALRRSDETLRVVVDNAPLVLWAVDSERVNTVLMGTGLDAVGIDPSERVDRPHGEMRLPNEEEYLDAALRGEDQTYSVSVKGRDFETRLVPLRDSGGAIEGAIGVSVDVTEQKRAERDLASLNQHLEELVAERTLELRAAQDGLIASERLAAVGHVTATVAHELRNPLATIRTSIFSLNMKVAERVDGTAEIFQRIERNVVRCDRIISELLDFSGSNDPQLETVDLNQCIAIWVDDYQASESVRLHLAISDSDAKVRVDQDRLHQVIVNLLDNASQTQGGQSDRGGGDAKIGVRTGVENGRFILEVADDGPGIPDNVLPRIFEPLYSTKGFGVGLGLPLVKKIIDQHNGDIEVTTGAGDGTTFRISLPLAQSKEAAA